MLKLLFLSDMADSFTIKLLSGIADYSKEKGPWTIRCMPSYYKKTAGISGILKWVDDLNINAIIGAFDEDDDIDSILDKGIAVISQDYKKRNRKVPNITGDYISTGRLAARYYIDRGFVNFGFFGMKDVDWSDGRCEGFTMEVKESKTDGYVHEYKLQDIEHYWFYDTDKLNQWLISLPKPIGIMACDDNQGTLLIEACQMAGIKIPSEVSVIGVNNNEFLCNLGAISLSSISVNIEEGGYRTAQMIEEMIKNPDKKFEDIVLKPIKVIDRFSSALYATDDKEIQRAILFIYNNRHKKISVDDVVSHVALSRRVLEIRFRKVTGQSIYQYIIDLKISLFADMLIETDEQIISIAISIGESDAKNITKRFKARYGCSPNEWRNRHAKNR